MQTFARLNLSSTFSFARWPTRLNLVRHGDRPHVQRGVSPGCVGVHVYLHCLWLLSTLTSLHICSRSAVAVAAANNAERSSILHALASLAPGSHAQPTLAPAVAAVTTALTPFAIAAAPPPLPAIMTELASSVRAQVCVPSGRPCDGYDASLASQLVCEQLSCCFEADSGSCSKDASGPPPEPPKEKPRHPKTRALPPTNPLHSNPSMTAVAHAVKGAWGTVRSARHLLRRREKQRSESAEAAAAHLFDVIAAAEKESPRAKPTAVPIEFESAGQPPPGALLVPGPDRPGPASPSDIYRNPNDQSSPYAAATGPSPFYNRPPNYRAMVRIAAPKPEPLVFSPGMYEYGSRPFHYSPETLQHRKGQDRPFNAVFNNHQPVAAPDLRRGLPPDPFTNPNPFEGLLSQVNAWNESQRWEDGSTDPQRKFMKQHGSFLQISIDQSEPAASERAHRTRAHRTRAHRTRDHRTHARAPRASLGVGVGVGAGGSTTSSSGARARLLALLQLRSAADGGGAHVQRSAVSVLETEAHTHVHAHALAGGGVSVASASSGGSTSGGAAPSTAASAAQTSDSVSLRSSRSTSTAGAETSTSRGSTARQRSRRLSTRSRAAAQSASSSRSELHPPLPFFVRLRGDGLSSTPARAPLPPLATTGPSTRGRVSSWAMTVSPSSPYYRSAMRGAGPPMATPPEPTSSADFEPHVVETLVRQHKWVPPVLYKPLSWFNPDHSPFPPSPRGRVFQVKHGMNLELIHPVPRLGLNFENQLAVHGSCDCA